MSILFEIPVTTITGEPTTLAPYKGHVLLIVNVASKCGLTPQYEGLEKLYSTYKHCGFDVLGFPANDFAGQEPGSEEDIKTIVWRQLKTCYDPEIPVNIVDLGLVYACDVSKNADETRTVDIKMTLTAPGCGMGEVLVQDVREKVQIVPTVARANVELVFDPPWNQSMMSDEARLQTGMM